MPGLGAAAADLAQGGGVLRRLARQLQRLGPAGRPGRQAAVHVEVSAHLAAFLGEQERQQRPRSQGAPEQGHDPGAEADPEADRRAAVPFEQVGPDAGVALLDVGEPRVEVALVRVALGVGQHAVEVSCLRLVLPVVGELVELGGGGRRGGGLRRRLG